MWSSARSGGQAWAMLPSSKYILRHPLLGDDDVVHAVHEHVHALEFGLEHFIGENGVRMVEHAAEEPRGRSAALMR